MEQVSQTVDKSPPIGVILEKGVLDRVDGGYVGVLYQDGVEKPGGIAFGTFQLLGNEYGLFGKIRIDRHRFSTNGGSTC